MERQERQVASESGIVRLLRDEDGHLWRVYELTYAYDRRRTSLVFESNEAMRRVRSFPSHWADLSDGELLDLSRRA